MILVQWQTLKKKSKWMEQRREEYEEKMVENSEGTNRRRFTRKGRLSLRRISHEVTNLNKSSTLNVDMDLIMMRLLMRKRIINSMKKSEILEDPILLHRKTKRLLSPTMIYIPWKLPIFPTTQKFL